MFPLTKLGKTGKNTKSVKLYSMEVCLFYTSSMHKTQLCLGEC